MGREFQYDNVMNFLKIMEEQKKLMEGQKADTDAAYHSEHDDEIRDCLSRISAVFAKGIEETSLDYAGFQGVHESILAQDLATGKELEDNYAKWKELDSRVKQLNSTLKTGISFGSAGYGEENRTFHVEQFLGGMENTRIVNEKMKEELLKEKYEAYKKGEKWKEVMREENLTKIELMALGRVGCGLGEDEFSGAGGFMELAESLGFDRVANTGAEIYDRMFGAVIQIDWAITYGKNQLSNLEVAALAFQILNFEKNDVVSWNKFLDMSILKGTLNQYYINFDLPFIAKSAGYQFNALQYYKLCQIEEDVPLNQWANNLLCLSYLASGGVDVDIINGFCVNDNYKPITKAELGNFYLDNQIMAFRGATHEQSELELEADYNCDGSFKKVFRNAGIHSMKKLMVSTKKGELKNDILNKFGREFRSNYIANSVTPDYLVKTVANWTIGLRPHVGPGYTAFLEFQKIKEMAEKRTNAEELNNLLNYNGIGHYFSSNVYSATLEGGKSEIITWLDFEKINLGASLVIKSQEQEGDKRISWADCIKIINGNLETISYSNYKQIRKTGEDDFLRADQFLKTPNMYLNIDHYGRFIIGTNVEELLKYDLSFNKDNAAMFLSTLEYLEKKLKNN